MKRSILSFGLVFFSAAALRADLVVVQRVEGGGKNQAAEMTLKAQGTKIRADVAPEVSTISDTATGETTTLIHSQKKYMQISADAARQLMGRVQSRPEAQLEPSKPEPTGKHETVNGIDTEIYNAKIGQTKVTYWVAKEFPGGDKLRELLKQLQNSPLAQLSQNPLPGDLPGIPVKTRIEPPDGQKLTVTVISVKEQPLDAADFEIPSQYQALPAPAFGAPQKSP